MSFCFKLQYLEVRVYIIYFNHNEVCRKYYGRQMLDNDVGTNWSMYILFMVYYFINIFLINNTNFISLNRYFIIIIIINVIYIYILYIFFFS